MIMRPFQWIREKELAIGSQDAAKDAALMDEKGITHIVSIGSKVANLHEKIQYKHYPEFLDAPFSELLPDGPLEEICTFVKKGIEGGGAVFIHCVKGYSRSSAALFGYTMWEKKLTYGKV